MKNERKVTFILLIIYFVILTWIILFKTQFSVSALPHIRSVNLIPFAESVVITGKWISMKSSIIVSYLSP